MSHYGEVRTALNEIKNENQKVKEELKKITQSVACSNTWNVTAAVYLQNFSVAAQETTPRGLFFKPDGSKMYVVGFTGDDVNEYDLSTPWDISTAVYLQLFSVVTQEISPEGLFFKPDGTKMYVIGAAGDDVNEYDLSTPWDVSTAVYLQNFSVATQETTPTGMFFKPDGSKMYVIGITGDDVNEYDLSTPWDISTAVYLQLFSVATQEISPQNIFFKHDGAKMYVVGDTGNNIYEYDLSTPWDVSTAVYLQNFSVATQETTPTGMFFKPDGTKMYVIGAAGDDVNEYDLRSLNSILTFSGKVYHNFVSGSNNASRFESTSLLLRDFVISSKIQDMNLGDASNQSFVLAKDSAWGGTLLNINSLWFRNSSVGTNGYLAILATRE